jgi:hypothetical protein
MGLIQRRLDRQAHDIEVAVPMIEALADVVSSAVSTPVAQQRRVTFLRPFPRGVLSLQIAAAGPLAGGHAQARTRRR